MYRGSTICPLTPSHLSHDISQLLEGCCHASVGRVVIIAGLSATVNARPPINRSIDHKNEAMGGGGGGGSVSAIIAYHHNHGVGGWGGDFVREGINTYFERAKHFGSHVAKKTFHWQVSTLPSWHRTWFTASVQVVAIGTGPEVVVSTECPSSSSHPGTL